VGVHRGAEGEPGDLVQKIPALLPQPPFCPVGSTVTPWRKPSLPAGMPRTFATLMMMVASVSRRLPFSILEMAAWSRPSSPPRAVWLQCFSALTRRNTGPKSSRASAAVSLGSS
jgi:hypothetical protein